MRGRTRARWFPIRHACHQRVHNKTGIAGGLANECCFWCLYVGKPVLMPDSMLAFSPQTEYGVGTGRGARNGCPGHEGLGFRFPRRSQCTKEVFP